MSERIHVLAQTLFGKSSVAECDLEEIRQLTQRYPYFAPAQFLLLEKLREVNSPEFHSQLQKAVLYYHNPLEFEFFISSERFYTDEEDASYKPQAGGEEKGIEESTINENEVEVDRNSTYANEEVNFIAQEHEVVAQEEKESGPSSNNDINYANDEEERINISDVASDAIEESEHFEGHAVPMVVFTNETEANTLNDSNEDTEVDNGNQVNSDIEPDLNLKLQIPLPAESLAKESNSEPLAFEPFHTVDYFASQGIKLSQEEAPKDRFGKQLKSFTEWLKTMKRLPVTEIPTPADATSETNVQHLAEDSVHETDIVTEAMAEVWLKQGNRQKALEIYNKLGLLNPSKRAYFAALIENVKRS
ncbi:MAG: hypothetical protein ACJ749_19530 [Flavisolibacter sp.]